MGCLDDNIISELIQGSLREAQILQVDEHLDECDLCRDLVAEATRARARTEDPAAEARSSSKPFQRPPAIPSIGELIAEKYRVEEVVGSGGMGVVIAATHVLLKRRVAIKLMHVDALGSREAVERFMREARASVRLKGEHAARVLDLGTLGNGAPYIVMEHLEGEDLGRLLAREGALASEVAASYVLQACEAIAEAHSLGVVHRDIKPANLFLTRKPDGAPCIKVLDFGLSKLSDSESLALTRPEAVMGSPLFMAPEQLASPREVDARADVWGLGATLQFLLSGRPPFASASPAVLSAAVLRDSPRALSGVPSGLADVVSRCLEKDPAKRPATAAELAQALVPFAGSGAQSLADRITAIGAPRITPYPAPAGSAGESRATRGTGRRPLARRWSPAAAVALIAGLALGGTGSFLAMRTGGTVPARVGPPVVLLMDTPAPHGVYDKVTVSRGGTNADDLSNLLRDLPVTLEKETLASTWNRESQVAKLAPDLVVIHRSAFFHALNLEFDLGYPPFHDAPAQARWKLLYRTADDKLVAFLGFVGSVNPRTRFLVYSRGTGAIDEIGWPDDAYRKSWVADAEARFPALRGRITTMLIAGGVGGGSFKNPATSGEFRGHVREILGMTSTQD